MDRILSDATPANGLSAPTTDRPEHSECKAPPVLALKKTSPGHTFVDWIVFTGDMNNTSTEKITASREAIRAFGRHYDYDVGYVEALMDASPGAFAAYEAAMPMGQYQKEAPTELLMIAKLATAQVEDCGPCLELGIKIARESKVPESLIRGSLQSGKGLSSEQLDVYRYAHAVAENADMDPELLPRIESRWGREVVAELAIAIVATRMYPALKRALGYAKRCSLMPELVA